MLEILYSRISDLASQVQASTFLKWFLHQLGLIQIILLNIQFITLICTFWTWFQLGLIQFLLLCICVFQMYFKIMSPKAFVVRKNFQKDFFNPYQNQWNKFEIFTWNWSIVLPYCTVGNEAMRKLCATVGTRGNKFEYLPKTKPVQIDWQCLIVLHDVQKPIQIQIQLKICCWGKSKCFTSQVIYVFMKTHRLTSIFLSPFCKESLIGLVLKTDGDCFCMVT